VRRSRTVNTALAITDAIRESHAGDDVINVETRGRYTSWIERRISVPSAPMCLCSKTTSGLQPSSHQACTSVVWSITSIRLSSTFSVCVWCPITRLPGGRHAWLVELALAARRCVKYDSWVSAVTPLIYTAMRGSLARSHFVVELLQQLTTFCQWNVTWGKMRSSNEILQLMIYTHCRWQRLAVLLFNR